MVDWNGVRPSAIHAMDEYLDDCSAGTGERFPADHREYPEAAVNASAIAR